MISIHICIVYSCHFQHLVDIMFIKKNFSVLHFCIVLCYCYIVFIGSWILFTECCTLFYCSIVFSYLMYVSFPCTWIQYNVWTKPSQQLKGCAIYQLWHVHILALITNKLLNCIPISGCSQNSRHLLSKCSPLKAWANFSNSNSCVKGKAE